MWGRHQFIFGVIEGVRFPTAITLYGFTVTKRPYDTIERTALEALE